MYPHVRDLFVDGLGYDRADILVDVHGEGGRPDLVVRAPAGLAEDQTDDLLIDWIVVEVKDERDAFTTPKKREAVFAKKAKYVGPDTEWFVMVDPTIIVARPVRSSSVSTTVDIELKIDPTISPSDFLEHFADLRREIAGAPPAIARFRAGDTALIASERLIARDGASERELNQVALNRRNFFATLRSTTAALQRACQRALSRLEPQLADIAAVESAFDAQFGPISITSDPLGLRGHPKSAELSQAYEIEAAKIRRFFARRAVAAHLELIGLRDFAVRKPAKDRSELLKLFGIETANLILARILLIRFLEDHGFFGDRKYVCNGGVAGFQGMREYFGQGYTKLLEQAYDKAGSLYAAAFDQTELDWVFSVDDEDLSRSVEWVMYQLSRYDFVTVRGDILTGIYDRFLDKATRKKFGEYYTPPSIARFILDELGLDETARVLDPACGSGTFLIERFEQAVGERAARGIAVFEEARAALERIAGADLNTFSAILAQIQLLWHLLVFKDDILGSEFPDILIAENADSIAPPALSHERHGLFSELDQPVYDAVVGNPPYVRSERAPTPTRAAEDYYETTRQGSNGQAWGGISAALNIFGLFIFRALSSWCRPEGDSAPAGKLGFVIPLSFCGGNEFAQLRRLFAPGGRWTILEIVDLEAVWETVFDADVLPMILFAQARPPKDDDKVLIRVADAKCVIQEAGRNSFDLMRAPTSELPYADIFSEDGRILTRIDPSRRTLLNKIGSKQRLSDVALRYWVKRSGADRGLATDTEPAFERASWEERRMIHGGVTFRRQMAIAQDGQGVPVYKGENIITGALVGAPARTNVDVAALNDPSVWRNPNILPDHGWAIPQIYTCPVAAPFNPRTIAFDNTVTLFFPRADVGIFPFDVFFASRVVTFYYALACRMSFLNKARSHLYPTNVRLLPWAESLLSSTDELLSLRSRLTAASERVFAKTEALDRELGALPSVSIRDAVLGLHSGKIDWSDGLGASDSRAVVATLGITAVDDGWRVMLDDDEWIQVPDEELAERAARGLFRMMGRDVSRRQILDCEIPADGATVQQFDYLVETFRKSDDAGELDKVLDEIDALVGLHFDLTSFDLTAIKNALEQDPLLASIRPRLPLSTTRLRGLRAGLGSSDRYR